MKGNERMKKIITLALVCIMIVGMLCGCNKQIIDLAYNYNYAIIELPNGEIVEGKISSWKDYEGDQLQIVIDGITYLVHSSDAVMMVK